MPPVPITVATVCAELAALPPGPVDAFVAHGFQRIAALFGVREGILVIGARTKPREGDPLAGFRMLRVWNVGSKNVSDTRVTDAVEADEKLLLDDPVARRHALNTGTHRMFHDPDPRTVPGLERSIDAQLWTHLGFRDHLKGTHALDNDRELYFGFHRFLDQGPFVRDDLKILEELLPLLRIWARRVALLCGCVRPGTLFSRREAEMLVLLLGGEPQKAHADVLGVSGPRARELVRAVHAKLGTETRAELQRLWISEHRELGEVPPVLGRTM